jgi:5-methyltetrahydropteroyltriglutamate--homocysteine methyltransferase
LGRGIASWRQGSDPKAKGTDKRARLHVEALNHALAAIPPERARMHLCWAIYVGPQHCDVPLAEIIDVAFAERPAAISSRPRTRAARMRDRRTRGLACEGH